MLLKVRLLRMYWKQKISYFINDETKQWNEAKSTIEFSLPGKFAKRYQLDKTLKM